MISVLEGESAVALSHHLSFKYQAKSNTDDGAF